MKKPKRSQIFPLFALIFLVSCQSVHLFKDPDLFEARQTEKLLGVKVQIFPDPQGLEGFDEVPPGAPALQFTVRAQALTGPEPEYSSTRRWSVEARAPDGSIYEGYSGWNAEEKVIKDSRFDSESTRQFYGYNPQDVYIGKRADALIKPDLFFPDIGSHGTAPYHFAIDSQGMVHLIVADVNVPQHNLDVYWVIGDPSSGRWRSAWLVDRRGFTSRSHPWTASWADKVNVLWNWCDLSINENAPGMGIFYLQWDPAGFGRKVRVVEGVPDSWDAAVDPDSGRLLLAYSDAKGVYITSREEGYSWTRPTPLDASLKRDYPVSVTSAANGTFIVRVRGDTREWVVRPR